MSERRPFRAGDVVRHIALDQEWLLACDEEHGRIAACGWPESWNRVEEVELVEEASDDVRLGRLRETAAMKGNDSRAAAAQRQLAAEGLPDAEPKPRRTLADVVANPPEGWVVYRSSDITLDFHWRPVEGRASAALAFTHGPRVRGWESWVRPTLTMKDQATAHRAVAKLLDVLAEVSDV